MLGLLRYNRGEHVVQVNACRKQIETLYPLHVKNNGLPTAGTVQFDPNQLLWFPPPIWKEKKAKHQKINKTNPITHEKSTTD